MSKNELSNRILRIRNNISLLTACVAEEARRKEQYFSAKNFTDSMNSPSLHERNADLLESYRAQLVEAQETVKFIKGQLDTEFAELSANMSHTL